MNSLDLQASIFNKIDFYKNIVEVNNNIINECNKIYDVIDDFERLFGTLNIGVKMLCDNLKSIIDKYKISIISENRRIYNNNQTSLKAFNKFNKLNNKKVSILNLFQKNFILNEINEINLLNEVCEETTTTSLSSNEPENNGKYVYVNVNCYPNG